MAAAVDDMAGLATTGGAAIVAAAGTAAAAAEDAVVALDSGWAVVGVAVVVFAGEGALVVL